MELSPREKIGSTFHKQRGTLLCGELATNGRREEGEGEGRGPRSACSHAAFGRSSEGRRLGRTWAVEI